MNNKKLFAKYEGKLDNSCEYIKQICDSAYNEDKEYIDEAIKYLGKR